MEKLNVFMLNELVGRLCLKPDNNYIFTYDEKYLKLESAQPVSLSMPLKDESYDHDGARSFFTNLLPEGDLRVRIAREKKISEDNDFLLLKAIGGECAGAVSLAENESPPVDENEYEHLSEHDLIKMIGSSLRKPLLISHDELRLSLAGAQNKIPLRFKNEQFYLPKGNSPSTHILKLISPGFEGLVENELFCMKLAKRAGLDVPDVFIWEAGSCRAFIIERYDRYYDSREWIHRLHQEDFCQITGTGPNRKYENEGGPGIQTCIDVINRFCSVPILEKKKFINWVLFNFFIGNCDAHAKNISMLYVNQEIKLAPFYDIVSTLIFPELSKKMAMHIGGKKQIDYLFKIHWERFANDVDIKYSTLQYELVSMAERLKIVSGELQETFIDTQDAAEVSSKIINVIRKQIRCIESLA